MSRHREQSSDMSISEPGISFVTESAILLQFAEPSLNSVDVELQARICQLASTLQAHLQIGPLLTDAVPGPGSLLLALRDGHAARRVLREAEQLWQHLEFNASAGQRHDIPVHYGGDHGPDLLAVAEITGFSPREVIQRHCSVDYFVLCLGFMPGFPYLGGMDPALATPRKDNPATRVMPGAVGIGGATTGIYPSASPGGWHIIGRTSIKLFDPEKQLPSLLQPGDWVRFVAVNEELPA
ncbi:MAG: allophanate hydrolase [Gammaproteobacteria bacterium]|nr:allophanate hydrolase [Gammaproteobacteria bacterium]MBJ56529.1 allophanate hydrolase [Gammaproteobacteria bacterium]HBN13778.1 allophanate hydrolase [Pseudohongiella sp.]|tara:strand:+ start:1170 stop:1886 length:717 start_codon:yes stop_codon:yes gene_type:complete